MGGAVDGLIFNNLYSKYQYDFGVPVITGFYRQGLTPDITGEAHLQADPYVVMGGANVFLQTSFGFWRLGGAASNLADFGLGFEVTLAYELSNLNIGDDVHRSFRVLSEYKSKDFALSGISAPINNIDLNFSMAYSQELLWDISGGISSNYAFGREDYGDRYGASLNLSRSFGRSMNAGLSVGYDKSASQNYPAQNSFIMQDGLHAMLTFSYRPEEKSSINASYDTRDGAARSDYRYSDGSGPGSWNANIGLDRRPDTGGGADNYGVNGSINYTANRADISLSHYANAVGLNGAKVNETTSLTMGTAFAYADGAAAMGRPIGNGFAIVAPHENLKDSEVMVGGMSGPDRGYPSSDFLGPALYSDVSSYSAMRLPVDVNNLPTGYDLGNSTLEIFAPYRSGYKLIVGSDYTVAAYGTVVNEKGEPIPLLTGDAYEEGHPEGRHVQIFTNRAGKFGAQGLRPGRWLIDMATEPDKTRFIIDVPQGTVGMLKLDTLKPVKS